jgi:predicted glycosyltransferase
MDFEHQPANHLAFRLARTILLPAALKPSGVRRQGAADGKTSYYTGLKEEIYLADFEPDGDLLERMGIHLSVDDMLVVARPAPDLAVYHSFENPLFVECVKRVLRDPRATVVVLPRHAGQREALADLGPRCVVATQAVDSRSLMSRANLMIGAGGTMTREAALLGVPTLSLFAGRRPLVDDWLLEQGFMRLLTDVSDLPELAPRPHADRLQGLRERGERLVEHFCDTVVAV